MSSGGGEGKGAPAPGSLVGGKYRVVDVVGSGGMGCLVKAEHLLMKKAVAIKFVRASRHGSAKRRLIQEGRATQSLLSEHVVRVYDLGLHEEAPYIVMELLEGTDLAARVQAEGPLSIDDAVDSVLEASVAVAEAHAAGIVHRDLKPANLFLARTAARELVKVLDFGISKVPLDESDDDPDTTAEDAVLGTPHYASPEQLRNPTKIDGRADVWSLGVTLFYLLSREHPFPGETGREAIAATFGDPPRSLVELRPEVPLELWRAIERTLAKRPEARTASVIDFARALEPFASKRGKVAVQKIVDTPAPRPPLLARRDDHAPSETSLTTEESLSSTLSSTEAEVIDRERTRARGDASVRRRTVALGVVLAGFLGVAWQFRSMAVAPPSAGPSATTNAAQQETVDSPLVVRAAAPTTELAAATAERSAITPAPPPIASPVAPLRSAGPRRASSAEVAVTVPATPSSSAPVRRDVDGVPIVE
jgi:serine/threonine protein kinase